METSSSGRLCKFTLLKGIGWAGPANTGRSTCMKYFINYIERHDKTKHSTQPVYSPLSFCL